MDRRSSLASQFARLPNVEPLLLMVELELPALKVHCHFFYESPQTFYGDFVVGLLVDDDDGEKNIKKEAVL